MMVKNISVLLPVIVKLYIRVDDCDCELLIKERLISEWFDLFKG